MSQLPPNQASWGFAGVATFLRTPLISEGAPIDADIVVLGVPSDSGSPFLPGSRMGPRSIREHSLRFGTEGYYDHRTRTTYLESVLSNMRLVDLGDVDVALADVEVTFERTTAMVRRALDANALPVVLGGDHAISYPVVRAFEEELHVVHFDAHIDYSPFEHGFMYSNMHAFRHIRRLANVESLTQVGIRSIRNKRGAIEDAVTDGNRVLPVDEFRAPWLQMASQPCCPRTLNCYVSIDIDVLDPAARARMRIC